jgi:gamma-glutamyltranspeptidase / glutathione hydrolase
MLPPRRPSPAFEGVLDLPGAPTRLWKEDGSPYAPGDLFVQPNLARTLRTIAEGGAEAFYQGEIARRIAEDMEAHGGFLRYEDLADYRVRRSRIVRGHFRGHEVVGTEYPAAGALTIEALQILDRLSPPGDDPVRWAADVARALQAAAVDGPISIQSPDLGASWLTSDSLATRRAAEIRSLAALAPPPGSQGGSDAGHTTHLTVVDRDGAVVAMTQSLGMGWGAMVVTDDLGFPYAMTMGYQRDTRPGARPGSYQSPTIVLNEGKVVYALGAAGSFRIIASIVQSLSRAIGQGEPFSLAVASRRVSPTGSSSMTMEDHPDARWSDEDMERLREAGWTIEPAESPFGILHGIAWDPETEVWIGVADPRGTGTARGPRDHPPAGAHDERGTRLERGGLHESRQP